MTAIIIFAAAGSVIRKLTEIGAHNLIDGRNPISFCNILFAGNICASIALILVYRQQWTAPALQQLSRKDWLSLTAVAILEGALAPTLIFTALAVTMVNNVILIGRIEPPLTLLLSVLLLRERVNKWVVGGAIASFLGVFLTILLQNQANNIANMGGFIHIGKGELLTGGWAVCIAISTIISKAKLRQIPLGIFTIFRTIIGTIIFFVIVMSQYGPLHFIDIFSPLLWQWMLFYGTVIVVGGQLCFFNGLKNSTASEVSLASSFSPIAGILASYLILGESPNIAQYIGGSAIVAGIILTQIGVFHQTTKTTVEPQSINPMKIDMEVGFKGV
ncbi:MAG TPA: DMT family transporter [Kamptonema sp.]|nr:DMT family transporter [Kamptonema sp.]